MRAATTPRADGRAPRLRYITELRGRWTPKRFATGCPVHTDDGEAAERRRVAPPRRARGGATRRRSAASPSSVWTGHPVANRFGVHRPRGSVIYRRRGARPSARGVV